MRSNDELEERNYALSVLNDDLLAKLARALHELDDWAALARDIGWHDGPRYRVKVALAELSFRRGLDNDGVSYVAIKFSGGVRPSASLASLVSEMSGGSLELVMESSTTAIVRVANQRLHQSPVIEMAYVILQALMKLSERN